MPQALLLTSGTQFSCFTCGTQFTCFTGTKVQILTPHTSSAADAASEEHRKIGHAESTVKSVKQSDAAAGESVRQTDTSLRQYWLAKHVKEMLLQEEILRFLEVNSIYLLYWHKRCSLYLIYWYQRGSQFTCCTGTKGTQFTCCMAQKRLSIYVLYWCKRTNADAKKKALLGALSLYHRVARSAGHVC